MVYNCCHFISNLLRTCQLAEHFLELYAARMQDFEAYIELEQCQFYYLCHQCKIGERRFNCNIIYQMLAKTDAYVFWNWLRMKPPKAPFNYGRGVPTAVWVQQSSAPVQHQRIHVVVEPSSDALLIN